MTFDTPENSALMRRFCSLGRNCEFGFAQRYAGAETLDLLRWANTPTPILLDLLHRSFAGIGVGLSLRTNPANGQYMVSNERSGLEWHAWVREGEIDPAALLRREASRMPRMAEILLETIAGGERILVRGPGTSDKPEDVAAIVAAIRPSTLLYVAEDRSRAGMVERVGERLLRGYIDGFETTVQLAHTGVWLSICRGALMA